MSLPVVLRRVISVLENEGARKYFDLLQELRGELDVLECRSPVGPSLVEPSLVEQSSVEANDVARLRSVVRSVERDYPLPRCKHGNAMRDHGGQWLEPSCGCRKKAEVGMDRRAAVEGEKFVWREVGIGGSHEVELEVCAKSPGSEGRWLCLSCGIPLEHNLDKDLHCQQEGRTSFPQRRMLRELGDGRARHVLGWRNFSSGHVEVP